MMNGFHPSIQAFFAFAMITATANAAFTDIPLLAPAFVGVMAGIVAYLPCEKCANDNGIKKDEK